MNEGDTGKAQPNRNFKVALTLDEATVVARALRFQRSDLARMIAEYGERGDDFTQLSEIAGITDDLLKREF